MSVAARRVLATYADLAALPPHVVGELISGELYASPRPALPHANAASMVGAELSGPFHRGRGGPGGWWILTEPELHFGEDALVPDVAGWRRERVPVLPRAAAMTVAPDWVCEVVSPSTARLDRSVKMAVYAREGVEWLWLVDPDARLLEAYSRQEATWLRVAVHSENDIAPIPPFEAINFELGALWEGVG